VAVIIGIVKFKPKGQPGGAWMVILAVPILVFVLVRVNKTYQAEEEDLLEGLEAIDRPLPKRHVAVLLVDQLDEKTFHALQYALTIQPKEIRIIHLRRDQTVAAGLQRAWAACGLSLPLEEVACDGKGRGTCLAGYLRRSCREDAQITVILPGPAHLSFGQRLRRARSWSGLVEPLRDLENVSVAVIRDHGGDGHRVELGRLNVSPRERHLAIILVGRLDRSVLKAVRYARAVEAMDIRALHAGVDPHLAAGLVEQWGKFGRALGIPLDVEECADRNVARTVINYIRDVEAPDAEVTVVLPRREYPRPLQRLLHDHTSRAIARALAEEAHVDVVAVPYRVRRRIRGRPAAPEPSPVAQTR
jgi:hypothetical protein